MKFDKTLYFIIILFLLISSILFFILSFKLDKNFFIKFSSDNELDESTLIKINNFRLGLLVLGLFSLFFIIFAIYFKRYIILFIRRKKEILQNLLLFVGTICFLILIGEVGLRVFFYNETNTYGFGPGTLKFESKYIVLNSEGMRDREFNIEKPENVIRIVGLGDSFTYGFGIKDSNEVYLKVLENKLNNNEKKYEVLNFGKSGVGTLDELDILKEKGLKYSPNIIIIGYVLNDFVNIDSEISNKYVAEFTIPYIGFWLRNFSYLYYFFETRVNRLLENVGYKTTYEDNLIRNFNSSINWEYNKKSFTEFVSISKDKNITILIIVFPLSYKFENYPFLSAHRFVKEVADENGFYVVDLLNIYNKYNESELINNKYDNHPNELAHRLAGEAILEKLINERILLNKYV